LPPTEHNNLHRRLKRVLVRTREKSKPELELLSVSSKHGIIPRKDSQFKGRNVSENLGNYLVVDQGDLVVNKLSITAGALGVSKFHGLVSPAYFTASISDPSFLPEYLHFLLKSDAMISEYKRLSKFMPPAQFDITWENFVSIEVAAPSKDFQNSVVGFLSNQLQKISILEKMLDGMKGRALESVGLRLWGELTIHLASGLNHTDGFRAVLESKLDWKLISNARLFSECDERNHPELPPLHVSLNSGVKLKSEIDEVYKQPPRDYSEQKVARKGDIVFNKMRMWQGAVGVAPCDGLVSTDYTVARPVEGIHPEYFMHLFKTEQYRTEINRWSRGIVPDRNRLYWDEFKAIKSLVPPYDEQARIVDEIRDMKAKTDALGRNIEAMCKLLKEYRSAIITAAVTGQIEIPEVIT